MQQLRLCLNLLWHMVGLWSVKEWARLTDLREVAAFSLGSSASGRCRFCVSRLSGFVDVECEVRLVSWTLHVLMP